MIKNQLKGGLELNDIKGTIAEYEELCLRLKDITYISSIEKAYLSANISDLRKEIKEKIEEGYARQERVKLMLRSIGFTACNKAIFRMNTDKVIKDWEQLEKFEKHMLRLNAVPNAHPELTPYNTVLKGDRSPGIALEDYYAKYNLKQYGKGEKRTRLCTELIYSVSPKFFYKPGTNVYDFNIIEKWIKVTMNYLEAQFPDGQLVWAMVHLSMKLHHIFTA